MPLNVVIPSNLDADFTIDTIKTKIYNNSVLIGTGAPIANPPVEEKVWLWARNDSGGVAGDYALSHIWEPATLTWEPLGASVDFRLSAVSVDASTGEVTFTITDPVSGTTSDIVTDLTNLVDVQETVTSLVEAEPGLLQYTDEDNVVNDVDVSGLRDTGQTEQRVEVIGDTFNIIPNGVDTRVVVNDISSTATFVDGATTSIHYTGDNVLGMSAPGDAGVVMTPDVIGASYVVSQTTGSVTAGLIAGDTGFNHIAASAVERDSVSDTSRATSNGITDAGYNFTNVSGASPAGSGSSMAVAAPSGNSVTQTLNVTATTSNYLLDVSDTSGSSSDISAGASAGEAIGDIMAIAGSATFTSTSIHYEADTTNAIYTLRTLSPDGDFDTTSNSLSSNTESKINLASKHFSEVEAYLDLETDGTDSLTNVGAGEPGSANTAYAKTIYTAGPTARTATTTAATNGTIDASVAVLADATTSSIALTSSAGTDLRNITIEPTAIKIGAGDVASNSVGGADGDVLVRFGTGSEVRFAPIGAAIGAELNVNTGTPALELEIGGSVVDTVPLVDVLDAFNVHQFYAIP